MATSPSNPREIQDRDKKAKATTGAQQPGRQEDAVRTPDGRDGGRDDGKSAGSGSANEKPKS